MTARQQRVFDFFVAFVRREGVPPTVRELAVEFEVNARAMAEMLERLTRDGHLRKRPGPRRAHVFVLPHRAQEVTV